LDKPAGMQVEAAGLPRQQLSYLIAGKSRAAITHCIEDLKQDGEKQRLGLVWLNHFISDVHQPFHAVGESRGGNRIKVTISESRPTCTPVGIAVLSGSQDTRPQTTPRSLIANSGWRYGDADVR
jgi:hypothetical protein